MQKDEPLKVIVPLAIVLALVFGVSIFFATQRVGFEDHPPDGPPPPPTERIWFEHGDTTQYDMVYYSTDLIVSSIWEPEVFSIFDVNIIVLDQLGEEVDWINWSYIDTDGDRNITEGDVITIAGMTDENRGGQLQVTQGDRILGSRHFRWNLGTLDYAVRLYWEYPIRETDLGYDTTFKVTGYRSTVEVNCTDLRFEVTDSAGRPLLTTQVLYNDTNGDGLVSLWDQVEVMMLPDDNYMGARVRVLYDDTLVGLDSVPVWTIE
jgi:hypothetical protein